MARTSRNGAPAASFDALDNIDIDDMFADDGDDLFDGLDMGIDLDQMGDITNNLGTEGTDTAVERDSAAEEKEKAPEAPPVAEEQPPRRKTKRKSKAPSHLDDDTDDEPPQKKKRRSTKSATSAKTTTKKKTSKKEKEEAKAETKSKSKVKSLSMPPPLTRPPSSGPPTPNQGQVAAAGQFGGRQKRGHFALPLSRSSSEKGAKKSKTTKATASTTSEATSSTEKSKPKKAAASAPAPAPPAKSSPEAPVAKAPAPFVPPMNQNLFCGLKPSNTLFYPFMPALPAEPSIKNRKQYPVVDRINSSFMSFINSSSTSNTPKPPNGITLAAETENIFRLMHDTLKDLNPSGGQASSNASQADKETAISTAIGSVRQTVAGMEKQKLAGDLFSVCALLKRQYDFLQQNLSNMERWCKENFSEADYQATYGSPESLKKQKEGAAAVSILAKFKKPLIKVKLKCNGFKEPKPGGPLFAFLPQSVTGSATPATSDKDGKSAKKRKGSVTEASSASQSNIPVMAEKEVVIKTYSELRPAKRRQLITDIVSQTAKELEAGFVSNIEARRQSIERRHNELKKLVEEDEVLVVHTAAMWQYIEKAGYFSDFTEEVLQDTLRDVWAPEMTSVAKRPTKHYLQPSNGRIQHSKTEPVESATGKSVFDGLQSLLVEEFSDEDEGEEGDDDETVDSNSGDEEVSISRHNFVEPAGTSSTPGLKLVDLSSLSVDERAFMHLRKAGLMENQPLPSKVSVPDFSESNSSWGRKGSQGGDESNGGENKLEDIVENMSKDLVRLNRSNNARASFLETAARNDLVKIRRAKGQADVESVLNAKCQQVLKKSKDKSKSSKPKIATKEEQVLPW